MPIYRLLHNLPMGSGEISRLTTAYEKTLHTIGLVDRNDRQEDNRDLANWRARAGEAFRAGDQGTWVEVRPPQLTASFIEAALLLRAGNAEDIGRMKQRSIFRAHLDY